MNQNPEQLARDIIDADLLWCGWVIQNKTQINLAASLGVAVRKYQTNIGPADYVLFVNNQPGYDLISQPIIDHKKTGIGCMLGGLKGRY